METVRKSGFNLYFVFFFPPDVHTGLLQMTSRYFAPRRISRARRGFARHWIRAWRPVVVRGRRFEPRSHSRGRTAVRKGRASAATHKTGVHSACAWNKLTEWFINGTGALCLRFNFHRFRGFLLGQSESEVCSEPLTPFTIFHDFAPLFTISYVENHIMSK